MFNAIDLETLLHPEPEILLAVKLRFTNPVCPTAGV